MHKELLIKLLGLAADASDEAITNAANTFQADMVAFKEESDSQVTELTNRAEAAEKAASAAKAAADTIANEAKAMAEELVANDLERYKDVIVNADEVKEQLMSNRKATVALLKNIKVPAKQAPPAPLHDPKKAGQPGPVTNAVADVSAADAKRISNRAREIATTLRISHQQAWTMAQGEVAKEAAAKE